MRGKQFRSSGASSRERQRMRLLTGALEMEGKQSGRQIGARQRELRQGTMRSEWAVSGLLIIMIVLDREGWNSRGVR